MWRRQLSTLQTLLQVTWEGREQRVTDQVRIRIVLSLPTPSANQKKYLEFGCEYGCTKLTFAIFRGGGGNI